MKEDAAHLTSPEAGSRKMFGVGHGFLEEIDSGSFFDNIDDFLDLPPEEASNVADGNDPCKALVVRPDSGEALRGSESAFSLANSDSDFSTELSVPYEEIVQLEWLSNFVEDSFSAAGTVAVQEISIAGRTSSPVSVLESSSSTSSGMTVTTTLSASALLGRNKPGRARSKRPRPPSFNFRPAAQILDEMDGLHPVQRPSEGFADSNAAKKRKKVRLSVAFMPDELRRVPNPTQPAAVRKCTHCEITKTPQWRAGPMGPKTLCNACGVRYKSGRLFPEYRPAASPTFVPTLHSNSHRKVVEMRSRGDHCRPSPTTAVADETASVTAPSPVKLLSESDGCQNASTL